jgi:hypothetical protein
MTYACPTWQYAADFHLLKLEPLQNRVFCADNLTETNKSANCMWLLILLKCMTTKLNCAGRRQK